MKASDIVPLEEKWEDIPSYEGLYKISSKGRVKSLGGIKKLFGDGPNSRISVVKDRILKAGIDNSGYYYVNLSKDGVQKTINIHRLVAESFIPNPKKFRDVNHRNGNKLDNNVENLEWLSHSANMKHSYAILKNKCDTRKKAVKHTQSGKIYTTITAAAKKHNISTTKISRCLNGEVDFDKKEWTLV